MFASCRNTTHDELRLQQTGLIKVRLVMWIINKTLQIKFVSLLDDMFCHFIQGPKYATLSNLTRGAMTDNV
jgi:hypothetical protein